MTPFPNGRTDVPLARWILAVVTGCLLSVGGYAYVAMRQDLSVLNQSDRLKGERIAVLESQYTTVISTLSRMEGKLDNLDRFANDMTAEQRSRNLYPKPKGHD